MARIAFGGMRHETNTFAPVPADLAEYKRASGYPGLTRGTAMFDDLAGINLSVSGFMEEALADGHDLVPLSWCFAVPSAPTTSEAFETITGWLVEDLRAAGRLDALYVDLHGAMVTDRYDDGDAEILRRLRDVVGPELPVVSSLDYHANVGRDLMALSSGLLAYRTYPHVDRAETGRRTARYLNDLLKRGAPAAKAFRQIPFLIPLTGQCTLVEPSSAIIQTLESLEGDGVDSLSYAAGFQLADIADCGASVFGFGPYGPAVEAAVNALAEEVAGREKEFGGTIYTPDAAVRRAMAMSDGARRPVVLADTQDNPGGGGPSDTVGLLEALVRCGARDAVVAMIYDPQVAAQAHAAGEGATLSAGLGAKSGGAPGQAPYQAQYVVEKLSDGEFDATGPMMAGMRYRLGPMALLRVGGVRIVVSSVRAQALDRGQLTHLGVDPAAQRILALKSSVHFRNDYQDIAAEVLIVEAPGPNTVDLSQLHYKKLRPGVRIASLERIQA